MRARIKTLGVSEHRFALASSKFSSVDESGRHSTYSIAPLDNVLGRDWLIYDVGGHRSCVSLRFVIVDSF